MKNLETEFKWQASSGAAFRRMLQAVKKSLPPGGLADKKQLRITDVYLDHPDNRFEKQQLAFRIRHYDAHWEATFKTRTQLCHGKAVRREETQPLPGVHSLSQALALLATQKRWKKLSVDGLQPLFTIRNKRILRWITHPYFQAELAFDSCTIVVGKKRVILKEIELELKRGREGDYEEFAQNVSRLSGLKRAKISKVKTAVLLKKGGQTV